MIATQFERLLVAECRRFARLELNGGSPDGADGNADHKASLGQELRYKLSEHRHILVKKVYD